MNLSQPVRPHVCAIQHIACETPGLIAEVLAAQGVALETVRTFLGEPVPRVIDRYDGLIVIGGPMGVYEQDQHPFLTDEIHLLQDAVRRDVPVLGVCLGSQLLAAALGAPVTPGPRKEIGWFPVTLSSQARERDPWRVLPRIFTALHWHGDVFALPNGAVTLASSGLTTHQAFQYGPAAFGILFHLEITEAILAGMVATFAEELRHAGIDGREIISQAANFLPELNVLGRALFLNWAGLVRLRSPNR
jgi:GMP synthase-like glutamine amidotransferase